MKPNEGIKTETREYIQIVALERLNNKLIVKLDFSENISKFFLADKFVAEYDKTIEDIIGKKAEDCEYCRFSPIHLKDNQTSPKLLGMLDWRKNVRDYIHTTKGRRATAKYYLPWANISKSAKDYKSATKYILNTFQNYKNYPRQYNVDVKMKYESLSDEEREFVDRFLPPPAKTGRPRVDDRRTPNRILFAIITGYKWANMPREFGAGVTAWRRLRRWWEEEIWGRIAAALRNEAYKVCKISRETVSTDSKTIEESEKRGGLVGYDGYKKMKGKMKGTKIYTAMSKEGLALGLWLNVGKEHDSRYFTDFADGIRVKTEKGSPRTRPDFLMLWRVLI
jgi:transposase